MPIRSIALEQIRVNPWQTRTTEAREVILRMAKSIAKEGLLQNPIGRVDPEDKERIQLAFGHTRFLAYQYLAAGKLKDAEKADFQTMDISIRKLTDRQMGELAIRENRDREDLSPIEEAQAMDRFIKAFDASTNDVAELWQIEASTVRSKMRLLRLPEAVQEHIHQGEIPERVGRTMLAVSRANPNKAEALGNLLSKNQDFTPEQVTGEIIRTMRDASRELGGPWDHGIAGRGWWPLVKPFETVADVPAIQAKKAILDLMGGDMKKAGTVSAAILEQLRLGLTTRELVQLKDQDPEAVDRIAQLRKPPACTTCAYHSEIDGRHFCNLEACFQVKKMAWRAQHVEQVRRKRKLKGFAWYDRKTDGRKAVSDYAHSPIAVKVKALAEEGKIADIRLDPTSGPLYDPDAITGSRFVRAVLVGKAAASFLRKASAAQDQKNWRKQQDELQRLEDESKRVVDAAEPHFAQLFVALTDVALGERIIRIIDRNDDWEDPQLFEEDDPTAKPKARLALMQSFLGHAWLVLCRPWEIYRQGGKVMADHLQGVAKQFSITLPDGWADQALAGAGDPPPADPEADQALDDLDLTETVDDQDEDPSSE